MQRGGLFYARIVESINQFGGQLIQCFYLHSHCSVCTHAARGEQEKDALIKWHPPYARIRNRCGTRGDIMAWPQPPFHQPPQPSQSPPHPRQLRHRPHRRLHRGLPQEQRETVRFSVMVSWLTTLRLCGESAQITSNQNT